MPRPICAEIDSKALSANLARVMAVVRSHNQQAKFWAVIKANAYGHGVSAVVSSFAAADGLAMLDLEEARKSREAGWKKPILMLEGPFSESDVRQAQQLGLTLVLHQPEQIRMLGQLQPGNPIDVYLKLETGMNRLGFPPHVYREAYLQVLDLQNKAVVRTISHMTHFACADSDEGVREPMQRFQEAIGDLPGDWCLANSAACLRHSTELGRLASNHHRDLWWRPGICLYGASPFDDESAQSLGLAPVMTLRSELISVKSVKAGEGVGYGHIFKAPHDMTIGVVACGYADGYPRHAVTGTTVYVAGKPVSLVGRVSMDMVMVDVTEVPHAHPGADVVLWGKGGPLVDEVASSAGTISYELLSGVTSRVPRKLK